MKRKSGIVALIAGIAGLLLAASCADEPRIPGARAQEAKAEGMMTFSKADQEKAQVLAPGASFEIRLPENPTTGYIWEVEHISEAVAGLEREAFEQEPADPRIVGRGGTKIFVFKAREPGAGEIALRLRRPWQRDAPIDSFVLKFEVRGEE